VRGDHGIGKTRLLLEVERRLRKGGYNVGWHLATCLPRGTELPLSGIQCMLQVLCGVVEGDPDVRIRQVVPRLRALGLHDDEVGAVLAALGASAGFSQANAKASLVNAFTRMVLRLSEDRPHAFAWDSAHCMDSDSFGVLEAVVSRIPHARALFVLAARAGFSHPIEKLSVHAALDLADLGAEDAERLVAVRLGVERVPGELMRFVRERAGGHPQMIEEILKALVEARAVTVADGSLVTMKLVGQDLALPKTLRGLVASRVARLAAAERAILQAAAVLGEPINAAVLSKITALDLTVLERSLSVLRDRGFLVHTGPLELRFTSPIVREVVVDALTAEAAREMHAAAGRALEEGLGAQAVEHASRIATHLYAAGDRERAGVWFAKSAARRLDNGQLETATRDFARAIELCDPASREPQELAAWLAGLAKAVRLVRALPEAMELCEKVIAHVDSSPDSHPDGLELRVRVRIDAGRILGALHMFDASRAQFSAAEAIAHDRQELVKSALVAAAEFSGRQGDFKRSLTLLERLQSIVTIGGDKIEEHKLLVSLVQTNAATGDHAAAKRHFERAISLVPDEPTFVCERHKLSALIDYFARDFRAAALHCEQAIDLARELGLQYEVAVNLHNLGDILVHLHDHARAYGAIKQSLALCDELGHDRLASHNRMFLAFLDGLAGDADAERVLLQGIRYAEANEFTWDLLGGRLLHARLVEHRGDMDGARLAFQKLRELARAAGNRLVADDSDAALRSMGSPPSQPPPPPA
jgi:tetratricopeptide (TPR) repeat protein